MEYKTEGVTLIEVPILTWIVTFENDTVSESMLRSLFCMLNKKLAKFSSRKYRKARLMFSILDKSEEDMLRFKELLEDYVATNVGAHSEIHEIDDEHLNGRDRAKFLIVNMTLDKDVKDFKVMLTKV